MQTSTYPVFLPVVCCFYTWMYGGDDGSLVFSLNVCRVMGAGLAPGKELLMYVVSAE